MLSYVAVPSTQFVEMLSPLLLLSWQALRPVLNTKFLLAEMVCEIEVS